MALIINDRVKETSTTEGTITFNLGGAATGFQTFVAGIGDTNTTYYAIFLQGSSQWEVGLGTVTDAATDTLARTTVISSSTGSKVDFDAGTKDVFCTLPASKAVFGKQEGTDFSNSLLVGHSTTGTLDAAVQNTGVGIAALDAITSGDANTCVGRASGSAINSGGGNSYYGTGSGSSNTTSNNNTALGADSLVFNVSGTANTAVGRTSMYGASGQSNNYNSALGYQSLLAITTGNYNTCVGHTSGNNITSGDGNVIIGDVAAGSATGDNQLVVGTYDGSSTTTWISGDSSGMVSANGGELTTTGKAFVMGF